MMGDPMKNLLLVCTIIIAAASLPLVAQGTAQPAKVDVTGTWELSFPGMDAPMTIVANYKQDGEKLTGTQTSPNGESPLEGSVKGNEITYTITGDMGAITFTGKVDGDTITGTLSFGDMGGMNWAAKRKK
jgi:D-glucosaminate-6-phosphate ammonia-lyase